MGRLSDQQLSELFNESNVDVETGEILDMPMFELDLNEVNTKAQSQAKSITERLCDYYFDEEYIQNHPYIPNKISQEIDSIRRLLKMLAINEKAQDTLIQQISMGMSKGIQYSALTSLQTTMINIQNKLDSSVEALERIFEQMQAECDKTYTEKEKDVMEDGSVSVRGSRELINMLMAQKEGKQYNSNDDTLSQVNYVDEDIA